jgi:hypothetical protein
MELLDGVGGGEQGRASGEMRPTPDSSHESTLRLNPLAARPGDHIQLTLAQMWTEAVCEFRRSVVLTPEQENMLMDRPHTNDFYRTALDEWETFRHPRKSGKAIEEFKGKLRFAVKIMQDKLPAMDVIIGYPTSAVVSEIKLR